MTAVALLTSRVWGGAEKHTAVLICEAQSGLMPSLQARQAAKN